MKTAITEKLGCEYPIVAFSHCRDVIAAVTSGGGYGVFGGYYYTPEEFDTELSWIDDHVNGKPYGVDIVLPVTFADDNLGASLDDLPERHKTFVGELMAKYDVPELTDDQREQASRKRSLLGRVYSQAAEQWDIASRHLVNSYTAALGTPTKELLDKAHGNGAVVGALVGSVKQALYQKAAGVDFIVAQGYEAGGHVGKVTTMVLVPDVVDAVGDLPVFAAGGIATGRQLAAALALGAAGAWTGSVWLGTHESEAHPYVREKFIHATAEDTVVSAAGTGKPARQLRSAWTDEWSDPANPSPLGMPGQGRLVAEAKLRIDRAAESEAHPGARELLNYYIGQVVGRIQSIQPARQVFEKMIQEYVEVMDRFESINS